MTEIAKSDLFFLITTGAVVVLSVIIAVLLVYLFIIVRDVKQVVHKVKEESNEVLNDVKELRLKIRSEQGAISRVSAIAGFLKKTFFGKKTRAKKE